MQHAHGHAAPLLRWAYFWRLAVVSLVDDLPPGAHHAVLTLEAERPASSVLKRPPSGQHWEVCRREGKDHKLWLMHWLIEETSEMERAVARRDPHPQPPPSAADGAAGRRLGGAAVALGGRRADP